MKEVVGDLFEQKCDAICVTTNGMLRKNGKGIMGGGVALHARDFVAPYVDLEYCLGACISHNGNVAQVIWTPDSSDEEFRDLLPSYAIVAFPTKHDWRNDSDLALIEDSCKRLVQIADKRGWNRICLTRPGCGLGNLTWSEVKPRISKLLDDRFVIVNPN